MRPSLNITRVLLDLSAPNTLRLNGRRNFGFSATSRNSGIAPQKETKDVNSMDQLLKAVSESFVLDT
jgi:hypothetical protein